MQRKNNASENKIIVYQAKSGAIELCSDFKRDTIWATQAQISEVFDIERSVIAKHIKKILSDNELDENSVCAKFAHTADDGKTYQVQFYNLDVILAVGYRTNSTKAIQFRQWATKTLKEHITKGYTINRKQIANNYDSFIKSVNDIQTLLPAHIALDPKSVLDLVKEFATTWISLDAYDKGFSKKIKYTKKSIKLSGDELTQAISQFRIKLISDGLATEIFAQERKEGSIGGIVGNVMQSFDGKHLYPSIEEKAAHLLYFFVKNHPFVDGNKRSGAFAFIWFLKKARILNRSKISPEAITALTLLVAESNHKDKDRIVGLILTILTR